MRRDDNEARWLVEPVVLPAAAATVVEVLAPLVTVARLARMDAVIGRRQRRFVPVLEHITDPHNVAAVMRSADAFGVQQLHVIEDGVTVPMTARRVGRGTDRWLEIRRHQRSEDCIRSLQSDGYRVLVASMEGAVTPIELGKFARVAVLFGNEHSGPSDDARRLADDSFAIPMNGFVESLNVSVAAAVTMFAATSGRSGDLDESEQLRLKAVFLMRCVDDALGILTKAGAFTAKPVGDPTT